MAPSLLKEGGDDDGDSLSGHDPLTSHLVERVLTFESSRVRAVLGRAHSDTELVDGHVASDRVSERPLFSHLCSKAHGSGCPKGTQTPETRNCQ